MMKAGVPKENSASRPPILPKSHAVHLPVQPAPRVPTPELAGRIRKIRDSMILEAVDGLVLTSRTSIEYLSDYRSLTWAYHSRPIFAVVTQDRFLLIASPAERRNVESENRSFEPAYYNGYLQEACRAVVDRVAHSVRKPEPRLAIDYGQDLFGRGALGILDGLVGLGAQLSSADSLIWRVRKIKSSFEATLKRTSFSIANAAFDAALEHACLGMTEIDLYRDVQSRLFLNGAESADPIAMIFGRSPFVYNRPPSARKLQPGDYIWTDFRSTYGGYPADRNRIARAGNPEPWEIDAYRGVRELTIELARSVRAGTETKQIYREFERLWDAAAIGPAYGLVSRIGHGGGLDVTEPPSISRDSDEIIESGMILHLEPKLELKGAVFQFEEIVFVRDDGVEFLSDLSPDNIPVVGGP